MKLKLLAAVCSLPFLYGCPPDNGQQLEIDLADSTKWTETVDDEAIMSADIDYADSGMNFRAVCENVLATERSYVRTSYEFSNENITSLEGTTIQFQFGQYSYSDFNANGEGSSAIEFRIVIDGQEVSFQVGQGGGSHDYSNKTLRFEFQSGGTARMVLDGEEVSSWTLETAETDDSDQIEIFGDSSNCDDLIASTGGEITGLTIEY